MVNKLILQGRMVADPELRHTQSGVSVCSFRVAWSKKYKETETKLFLSCTAWRGTGELVAKHFTKGKEIILEGELATRSWQDDNGNNRQTTELTVDQVHFVGSKSDSGGGSSYQPPFPNVSGADFTDVDDDGDIPF